MSTLTGRDVSTRFATLPRVNLLPPEIDEQRRFKRVQGLLGIGVLASVGVVGALFLVANGQVTSAQDELSSQQAKGRSLDAQAAKYAEVPLVYAQVDAARTQLAAAMGQEVRYSYLLNNLSLNTPGKVWLTSMTVEQPDTATIAAPSAVAAPDYLTPGIGTLVFQGHGYTHNDVAAWLKALATTDGLAQPYFTSSKVEPIGSESSVTFTSQATLTDAALSKRFTDKAGS
jgi:Tfp pilus assembly protein PilN